MHTKFWMHTKVPSFKRRNIDKGVVIAIKEQSIYKKHVRTIDKEVYSKLRVWQVQNTVQGLGSRNSRSR